MKKIIPSVTIAWWLSGCVVLVPGHLYPIQGSLAGETPLPIYTVTLNGVLNSGNISATLSEGEVCTGKWSQVQGNDPTAASMSRDWDAVYGPGFFVANVLGSPVFARATISSPKGTTLNVQMFGLTPGIMSGIRGVATDNHGNTFKLTF